MRNVTLLVSLVVFSAGVFADCQPVNTESISQQAKSMINSQGIKSTYAVEKAINTELQSISQFNHKVDQSINAQVNYLSCINDANTLVVASLSDDGALHLRNEDAIGELQVADNGAGYYRLMDQLF